MNLKSMLLKLVARSFAPQGNQSASVLFRNASQENPCIFVENGYQRSFYPVPWLNQFTASAMLREFDSHNEENSYPSLRKI